MPFDRARFAAIWLSSAEASTGKTSGDRIAVTRLYTRPLLQPSHPVSFSDVSRLWCAAVAQLRSLPETSPLSFTAASFSDVSRLWCTAELLSCALCPRLGGPRLLFLDVVSFQQLSCYVICLAQGCSMRNAKADTTRARGREASRGEGAQKTRATAGGAPVSAPA